MFIHGISIFLSTTNNNKSIMETKRNTIQFFLFISFLVCVQVVVEAVQGLPGRQIHSDLLYGHKSGVLAQEALLGMSSLFLVCGVAEDVMPQ